MRSAKKLLVSALAGTFALALFSTTAVAAPPRGGPDRSEPNFARDAGGNPLGDASMAVLRQQAAAKAKAKKEMSFKAETPVAPAPARPTPPSLK